jgi:hypothetical protein
VLPLAGPYASAFELDQTFSLFLSPIACDLLVASAVPSAFCSSSMLCLEIAGFFEFAVWEFRFLVQHCSLTLTLTCNMNYELQIIIQNPLSPARSELKNKKLLLKKEGHRINPKRQ